MRRPITTLLFVYLSALLLTLFLNPENLSVEAASPRPRSLNFHEVRDGKVSSYSVTPAVQKYRRDLAEKHREKRMRRDKPPAPVAPRTQPTVRNFAPRTTHASRASLYESHIVQERTDNFDSSLHAHRRHHRKKTVIPQTLASRQLDNLSCNNITITPPGFDGSCSVDSPCPNGACCGASNFCGYGDTFCGAGCQSHCDAKAECGPNALPGHEKCALNVCCSRFGFCGSTDEFCGADCVGDNCGEPSLPSGGSADVTSRIIGYYEGWASGRPCDAWFPQTIPASAYTHLNYAFASIDPNTFHVVPADANDVSQYTAFTNLKQNNPNLKTFISVGGWAFNDPPTQHVFSDTAGDAGNRQAFATSLVSFMIQYGFDGVDIDWEYPVACERGGVPADRDNFTLLMATLRSTFDASGHTFGLTFTAPSSFWYLQHFDVPAVLKYADWVNLMSYDLHGVWDAKDVFIGSIVQAHTNLTEIKQSVQLFQRVGIPTDRIVLGLGFYGRTFELVDAACSKPGCAFSGPAPAGTCTDAEGILSFSEIQAILSRNTSTHIVYDEEAEVKYLVYDDTHWVSYDDAQTLKAKVDFAKDANFGGLMVWAVDQDDFAGTAISAVLGQDATIQIPSAHDINTRDGASCTQVGCGESCPSGYVQMTDVTTGDLANPKSGCDHDQGRPVCCPVDRIPEDCQWRGSADFFGCNGVCLPGEISLAGDSWGTGHKCSSGHKEFCCKSGLTDAEIDAATNCQWCKQSNHCNDNQCPAGTFTKATDYYGDTNIFHACLGVQEKSLCCFPPSDASLLSPITAEDLFENPPENGDFHPTIQEDPIDENTPNGGVGEDNNAFGMIAMDGPSSLLSTMDLASNWVIVGCTNSTDLQNVTAFCSKAEDDPSSGCSAVFEKGAKNTIVKMPTACSPGPYARLAHLEVNNMLSLPPTASSKKPDANPVYEMHFDFNFHLLAGTRTAADGEVLVRIDATNMPGYWSEIDTADPGSPVKRGLIEQRWFGSFGDWLSRVNKVETGSAADLGMGRSFHQVLYSASQSCGSEDGTTQFTASLDVTAFGSANLHVTYGYYMQGTLFPPNINEAYVYAAADASASLGFQVSGMATVSYSSSKIGLIPQVSWPGLTYPGIVVIGPTFNIYGLLEGQITASGTFGVTNQYKFPGGRVAWGLVGDPGNSDHGIGGNVEPTPYSWTITPNLDIQIGGSLNLHVIPEAGLVVDLFPGTPAHQGIIGYISADASLGLNLNANLDSASVHVGLNLDFVGGVDTLSGSTRTPALGPFNFYHNSWTIYENALNFGSNSKRGLESYHLLGPLEPGLGYSLLDGPIPYLNESIHSPFARRSLFNGDLSCPTKSPTDCQGELEDDSADPSDPDDVANELERRYLEGNLTEIEHELFERGDIFARVATGCGGLTITPPAYQGTIPLGHYDLAASQNPASFAVANHGNNAQPWAAQNPNTGAAQATTGYAREHVYEAQMITAFMQDIFRPAAGSAELNGMTYCAWLQGFVFGTPFAPQGQQQSLADAIRGRLPHLANAADQMPLLNQISNQAKAAFIVNGRRQFRKASTLNSKQPGTILYLIRQAGASIAYMNDPQVHGKFVHVADLIRQDYVDFFQLYNALVLAPNGTPPVNIAQVYNTWINNNLQTYVTQANSFLQVAKNSLNTKINAAGGTLNVGVPLFCSNTQVQIDTNFVNGLIYPGINWVY